MAPARRVALLEWAARTDRLVIEDDYDAEFRYDRTPVGAVQGLDPRRVAHVGTTSKPLPPAFTSAGSAPRPNSSATMQARKSVADSGSPAADQLALASLLASGDYEKHIVRARHIYRRHRDLLLQALTARFPHLQVSGAAGMQLLLPLPGHADDISLAEAAAARGIGVTALSPLHLARAEDRGLLLGFGCLPEHKIPRAVDALWPVLTQAGAAFSPSHHRQARR